MRLFIASCSHLSCHSPQLSMAILPLSISYHNVRRHFCTPTFLLLPQHQQENQQKQNCCSLQEQIPYLCRNGRLHEALNALREMDHQNIRAESITYASLLQACGDMKALDQGKQLHAHIKAHTKSITNTNAFEESVFLQTNLITMYGKCGSVEDARDTFDGIKSPNIFTYKAMFRAYAAQEQNEEILELYNCMKSGPVDIKLDSFSFVIVLKACASLGNLKLGRYVHQDVVRYGMTSDVFVGNALASMYVKCGSIEEARQVFDKMSLRDVVSWNGMIAGYGQWGRFFDSLGMFRGMVEEGVRPNSMTMVSVLPVYGQLGWILGGKEVHGYVIRNGFEGDGIASNGLVSMYAKCGRLDNARHVFEKMLHRNVASWNAMIAGYAQNGYYNEALILFREMQRGGVKPNSLSISSILPACSCLAALQLGKEIHAYIIKTGMELNVIVASAVMDVYAKCGRVRESFQVFQKMSRKDVVAWNVMIAGHAHNSGFNKVLELFGEMLQADVRPDTFTIVSVLLACAHLATLHHGKDIHGYIIRHGLESNAIVGSAIVDMYAKCGCVDKAWKWFMKVPQRDLVLWNAMIAGYGMHGHGREAIKIFHKMKKAGMTPDQVTFTAILSACSHAGLVDEGWQYFNQITNKYHMTPTVEHYSCMVDLLGRAGHLDEAYEFVQNMPLVPNRNVWGTLLGACRNFGNVKLGEYVAEKLFEMEPENEGNYVLLSNIYAAASRWDGVQMVRQMMRDRGIKKNPGCSWIEFQNRVHVFLVGDRNHPQTDAIYDVLENLTKQMKGLGYVPDTKFVLHNVDEPEKERILCSHSERLAIAFGLINTYKGTPIRITKNLRVCGDCHTATKFMSEITNREIIVRDTNRFHHFKDGLCSCGDYW